MKQISRKGFITFKLAILILCLSTKMFGQSLYSAKITIEGTSNIHDWIMKSDKGSGNAAITIGPNNTIISLSNLNFSMQVESLKSEHKGMDKNTYKAMNTDKNPTITFTAATATVKPNGTNSFQVIAHGKLTINGNSKNTDVTATCLVGTDKSVSCSGSYKLKMTEFKVEPPSIMFGAITVGDDLNVKYTVSYK